MRVSCMLTDYIRVIQTDILMLHFPTNKGYQWLAIAEALASGQETWGKVFGEWKHTNNVADLMTDENLHDFGCGVANDANGRPFWVALFGREGDKYSYSKCAHTRTCHNNTASVVGTSFWEEAW